MSYKTITGSPNASDVTVGNKVLSAVLIVDGILASAILIASALLVPQYRWSFFDENAVFLLIPMLVVVAFLVFVWSAVKQHATKSSALVPIFFATMTTLFSAYCTWQTYVDLTFGTEGDFDLLWWNYISIIGVIVTVLTAPLVVWRNAHTFQWVFVTLFALAVLVSFAVFTLYH